MAAVAVVQTEGCGDHCFVAASQYVFDRSDGAFGGIEASCETREEDGFGRSGCQEVDGVHRARLADAIDAAAADWKRHVATMPASPIDEGYVPVEKKSASAAGG